MQQLTEQMRPNSLTDLYGQGHIVDVLQTAAKHGELDNYRVLLFVGPRGCGKTSTARIMAKIHNCLDDKYVSLHGEACNACANCLAIADRTTSNTGVTELDGGSTGNVNAIREILEECRYSPTGSFKKRVYIIDEAHQISPEAKSALLKIMEEPPPHVVFILATTERVKVPIPIQSRCQIFKFRLSNPQGIADYLKTVVTAQGMTADDAALVKIGSLATGSFRDAIQVMTKVFTMTSATHLTLHDVEDSLGLPDSYLTNEIVGSIIAQNGKATLLKLRDALGNGVSPEAIVTEVANKFGNSSIERVETSTSSTVKGWTIPELIELALYIKETAPRFTGTDYGGLGASIALMMACYWRK